MLAMVQIASSTNDNTSRKENNVESKDENENIVKDEVYHVDTNHRKQDEHKQK